MATTLYARAANRLSRRGATRGGGKQQTRAALEMRLLALADAHATATARTLIMGEPVTRDAPLPVLAWLRHASMRLRTLTVQVPLWLTVFAVVAGAYAPHGGGTSALPVSSAPPAAVPPAPPAATSFTANAAGSNRLVIPVTAGDNALRVGVSPTFAGSAGWFWCLESDRPLTPEQHVCGSAGVLDPASGYVQSGGGVHVDAALAEGATFFVQMYCPTGCQWRVDVAARPADSATLQ